MFFFRACRETTFSRGFLSKTVLTCVSMAEVTFDGISEPVVLPPVGRGRKRSGAGRLRDAAKRARHSGVGKESVVSCQHDSEFCGAGSLSPEDLAANHQMSVVLIFIILFLW